MLTILIGIGVCIIFVLGVLKFGNVREIDSNGLAALAVMIILFSIVLSIIITPNYSELELYQEVQLISLNSIKETEGEPIYVVVASNNVYSYRHKIDNEYSIGGETYKINTLSGKVTEIESNNCTVPILKVYERKPVFSWFSLWFVHSNKYEYVFFVPQGTIVKD